MELLLEGLTFIFKFIVPLLITFYLGWRTEKWSHKRSHDVNIFSAIDNITSSEFITLMIEQSQIGYLPKNTFPKTDKLAFFIKNPKNKYIDKKIQVAFNEFFESFYILSNFYSLSSIGGYVGDGEFKLVLDKKGDFKKEEEMYKKSREYSLQLEKKYNSYMSIIKSKLFI